MSEVSECLTSLAARWGSPDVRHRTHVAWRSVGADEARRLCLALMAADEDDRARVGEHACSRDAGWGLQLLHFMHFQAECAARGRDIDALRCVVMAALLMHGRTDWRDTLLLLQLYRRSCRIIRVRTEEPLEDVFRRSRSEAARSIRFAAAGGLSRLGLRLRGWRESGSGSALTFNSVLDERIRANASRWRKMTSRLEPGSLPYQNMAAMLWSASEDPGPIPERLSPERVGVPLREAHGDAGSAAT